MKVAYVTEYDAHDVRQWSGTGYFIAESLKKHNIALNYVGPLQDKLTYKLVRKTKRFYYSLLGQKYMKDPEPYILKGFASEITRKLKDSKADFVLSATTNPVAYLDCELPIVFWADATFENLIDFYPSYSNLCPETVNNWHRMESFALEKASLAIYSSDWAAQTAIDYYGADKSKVKVVPLGANLQHGYSAEKVKSKIYARPSNKCKLLFLGVDWYRKGGDIALRVTERLRAMGLDAELNIVGCDPVLEGELPDFVSLLGYISKSSEEGKKKISELIAESHFLIVPSRAECYGVVFCEANSLGVPSIATDVGGIPTIIKDNVNGMKFPISAAIEQYCNYILHLFDDYSRYQALALSSLKEYETRLNWGTSAMELSRLMCSL